jgi:16S rRNA C1402 (ribose-2'-O) methylase RsmI
MQNKENGTLFISSQPIGDYKDLSENFYDTLKIVDHVYLKEGLIDFFENYFKKENIDFSEIIKIYFKYPEGKDTLSHEDWSKADQNIIDDLNLNKTIMFVVEGGTPGIVDTGASLIENVRKFSPNTIIKTNPGVSAVTAAISLSGFHCENFYFGGWLSENKNDRINQLSKVKNLSSNLSVFFFKGHDESLNKITNDDYIEQLIDIKEILNDPECFLASSITRKDEELINGKVYDIIKWIRSKEDTKLVMTIVIKNNIGYK